MARTRKKTIGFVRIAFLLVITATAAFVGFYLIYPDVTFLKKVNPKKTSFMEYREDQYRAKGKKLQIQKKWIPLSQVSPYLLKAILIAEDDKFWSHRGFDVEAMQKALEKDLEQGKFKMGGSTISQQLVKNLYLTPAKNPLRKLKEAIITWRLEQALSKRRILELYVNVVEWGNGLFGAEMASQRYFGKSASQLTAEEASKLAAILPNPIRYKVDGTSKYTERRSRIIYSIMVRRGIVIPEYEEVISTQREEQEGTGEHDSQSEVAPETGSKENVKQ